MRFQKFKILYLVFCILYLVSGTSYASRVQELQNEIQNQGSQISEIEKEIAEYQKQIDATLEESGTLKNEIGRLEASRRKLLSSISLKKKQIEKANFNIEKLGIEITEKDIQINDKRETLGELIRKIDENESQTIVEIILGNNKFSDFYNDLNQIRNFQDSININLSELKNLKVTLEEKTLEEKTQKTSLINYKDELEDQKYLTEQNKSKKNILLSKTKNKEENYRRLMEEKKRQKYEFERELLELEAQLKIEIDPNSLPSTGKGILAWPLDLVKITQYFGNTPFATRNSQIYNGKGHTGVDFRASTGTKIKSSSGGVVEGIGDTDKISNGSKVKISFNRVNVRKTPNGSVIGSQRYGRVGTIIDGPITKGSYDWWKINFNRGSDGWVADVAFNGTCYSFGKWVLVRHHNGLSTLYAHLSLIKVNTGDAVTVGQTIGYSGATGYATGPHLHFGVYASQGVKITKFTNSINCKNMEVPIADRSAYLNPLSYL